MPPAEAMMTGCPVVGNDTMLSGTKDYLFDGVSGRVAKNDYTDFRNCVEYMYKNKEKRLDMGILARECVESIGSREKNMKKWKREWMDRPRCLWIAWSYCGRV